MHQHDIGIGIFQHEQQAILRIGRVQRHKRSPSLKNAQNARHHFHGTLGTNSNAKSWFNTPLHQHTTDTIGQRVQFGVAQALLLKFDRGGVRISLHLGLEALDNAVVALVRNTGLIKVKQQLLTIGSTQQRQAINTDARIFHDGHQQVFEVSHHALDRRTLEQIGGVFPIALDDALLFTQVNRDIKFGGMRLLRQQLDIQPRQLQGIGCRGVLQHKHHLK